MTKELSERKDALKSILLFLSIVTILSTIFHLAIVNLYPSRLYTGALMWCPALAAIITLKIKGKSLSNLNWNWGKWKYIRLAYIIPVLYVAITYILIWIFGLGGFLNEDTLSGWAKEIGLEGVNSTLVLVIVFILLGTVGVIRSMATVVGEEIGWRGFFVYELRKIFSFTGVSVISGIIWGLWHWPLIVYYGHGNIELEMATLIIGTVSMSFIITYYTFKSKSLWPAVILHAVSNVYIQKIFTPITVRIESTAFWIDEDGIMVTIVISLFAIYYWRKAKVENL